MESHRLENTIKLFYCLENIDIANNLVTYLNPDELDRASRFTSDKDRGAYMVSHAFLNVLCSKELQFKPRQIVYSKNSFGKPYVKERNFNFNLSHSKNNWCLAVSAYEIGIDLEEINRNFNYYDILERYFSENEQQTIKQAKDPYMEFFKFWTRKEALLKAAGTGLIDDLAKVEVIKSTVIHRNITYFLHSTKIRNSYISLATCKNISIENIEITSQNYFTYFPISINIFKLNT